MYLYIYIFISWLFVGSLQPVLSLVMETHPRALLLDLAQYRTCIWRCCHTKPKAVALVTHLAQASLAFSSAGLIPDWFKS